MMIHLARPHPEWEITGHERILLFLHQNHRLLKIYPTLLESMVLAQYGYSKLNNLAYEMGPPWSNIL